VTTIRRATVSDLLAMEEIQRASPEAAQWRVPEYLDQDCWVAVVEDHVAGFLVCRAVAAEEREVLNIAVAPEFRRSGIARALLEADCNRNTADCFLEVRASNQVARAMYNVMGFTEDGIRPGYYDNPHESGIVMKRRSCYRHIVRRP
jgi:ribosomal-protein-alanine N-acetyltransferase